MRGANEKCVLITVPLEEWCQQKQEHGPGSSVIAAGGLGSNSMGLVVLVWNILARAWFL